MNTNNNSTTASLSAAIAPDNVLRIEFGYDEHDCTACRGRGCRVCVGFGTAEAQTIYWETRRLLLDVQHAA